MAIATDLIGARVCREGYSGTVRGIVRGVTYDEKCKCHVLLVEKDDGRLEQTTHDGIVIVR